MKIEQPKNLKELTIELLRADALPAEQADQIVDAPHLLKSVRARIAAEKFARETAANSRAASANNFWRKLFAFVSPRKIGFAAACLAFAIVVWQSGVLSLITQAPENVATDTAVATQNQAIESNNLAAIEEPTQLATARVSLVENSSKLLRAATTSSAAPTNKIKNRIAAAQAAPPKQAKMQRNQNAPREFYQLAFAGELDANETKQIVRVKLSPDALGALGVNVVPATAQPAQTITADLLLGEDGVPRAIRFVK